MAATRDGVRELRRHNSGDVLIAGDVFVHALQVVEPASRYVFDQDSDEAVRTRVAMLGSARSLGARLGTAHLHSAFVWL